MAINTINHYDIRKKNNYRVGRLEESKETVASKLLEDHGENQISDCFAAALSNFHKIIDVLLLFLSG